jgi:oligopeptide transport system substrate-binding protein
MRLRVFALLLASIALLLTACGKRETPAEAGLRTKTLLLGNQNEPASLDPHVVDSLTDGIILASLYEGLTVTDEKSSSALPGPPRSSRS